MIPEEEGKMFVVQNFESCALGFCVRVSNQGEAT
jgi:hypothetical protein